MPRPRLVPSLAVVAGALLALPVGASAATITTFPVPTADAGLAGIAKAPDGSLWITEHRARRIAHVGLDGAIGEIVVPNKTAGGDDDGNIGPTDIVADASGGTMDFLTDIGSSVGFVTPAGQVTTYHDGYDNAQSISPAKGGGVWEVFFLSSRDPELEAATVHADGSITGYPGTSKIGYSPMATRADGRMFWGDGGDAIRSLTETASGEPQDAPLPPGHASDDVTSVAFDGAGTLFFTEYDTGDGHPQLANGGLLGTVDANGQASVADLGGDVLPRSLVLGPDGALWWAEKNGLGRLAPGGAVQHASLGSFDPAVIAFGGDGALWFVDANANRVGRVAIDAALFPVAAPPIAPVAPVAPSTTTLPAGPAITLRASTQRLSTVRRRRTLSVPTALAGPGTLSVRATLTPATAKTLHLKVPTGATSVTLATASHAFRKAGKATLILRFGPKARSALRRARHTITLTLRATATRTGEQTVTTTQAVRLKR